MRYGLSMDRVAELVQDCIYGRYDALDYNKFNHGMQDMIGDHRYKVQLLASSGDTMIIKFCGAKMYVWFDYKEGRYRVESMF